MSKEILHFMSIIHILLLKLWKMGDCDMSLGKNNTEKTRGYAKI